MTRLTAFIKCRNFHGYWWGETWVSDRFCLYRSSSDSVCTVGTITGLFFPSGNSCHVVLSFLVSPTMSLASVHPSAGLSHRSQSFGSVSSLDDHHGSYYSSASEAVISIEELKLQLNSCFTCGVSWQQDHVSLDCAECGGYSLERPCPLCEGRCSNVWKRDLTMSHACGKARWEGECRLILKPVTGDDESRLCKRLEKLAANS